MTHLPVSEQTFTLPVLITGLFLCARNQFQNLAPTAYDDAQDRLREPRFAIFWPGLAVFVAGVAAGHVPRVVQDGVSPGVALTHGVTIVVVGFVLVGLGFVASRVKRRKQ